MGHKKKGTHEIFLKLWSKQNFFNVSHRNHKKEIHYESLQVYIAIKGPVLSLFIPLFFVRS